MASKSLESSEHEMLTAADIPQTMNKVAGNTRKTHACRGWESYADHHCMKKIFVYRCFSRTTSPVVPSLVACSHRRRRGEMGETKAQGEPGRSQEKEENQCVAS